MNDRMPNPEEVAQITDGIEDAIDGRRAIDVLAAAQDLLVMALSHVATDEENAAAIWEHMKVALTDHIKSDFKKHKAIQRAVERHKRDSAH